MMDMFEEEKNDALLLVTGVAELKSLEGTTQGDPTAMPGYGIGVFHLLTVVKNETKQATFADDPAGVKALRDILQWWKNIETFGPLLGYYPKASKSWLVVKPEVLAEAEAMFNGTGVNIMTQENEYLVGFFGNFEGKSSYCVELVQEWIQQLLVLCEIAKTEPRAAYAAFVGGFRHKLTYHISGHQRHDHIPSTV